jgi:hypothetical protein
MLQLSKWTKYSLEISIAKKWMQRIRLFADFQAEGPWSKQVGGQYFEALSIVMDIPASPGRAAPACPQGPVCPPSVVASVAM